MRRFLLRFDLREQWQDYALDRVLFGDACAGTLLEVGKDLVADKGEHLDPEAAQRLRDDVYVDDGLTGGDYEQVARFAKGWKLVKY